MITQANSKVVVQTLMDEPNTQLQYLQSSFDENWETPELISSSLNHVAEAKRIEDRLESSDFFAILHFTKKLGFKLTLTDKVKA